METIKHTVFVFLSFLRICIICFMAVATFVFCQKMFLLMGKIFYLTYTGELDSGTFE